jgi:peptidoglycan/LPS O-acetylase OafA/YrhL
VFEGNLLREVNGALWTLKIEVMFYAAVPIFAWAFRKIGHLRVIAAVYVLSIAYWYGMGLLAAKTDSATYVALGRQLPGQLSYFMVGAFFFYYFDFFVRRAAWFAAGAVLLAVTGWFLPLDPLEPFWLGTLVALAAFFAYAGRFGRYGDFSYGIYILHFPVVQTLVYLGLFAWSPWAATAVAAAIVLCLAALLWHFVEKPWLKSSSHYRQETTLVGGAAVVEQKV